MLYHNGAVEISEFPRTLRSLYVPGIDHIVLSKESAIPDELPSQRKTVLFEI